MKHDDPCMFSIPCSIKSTKFEHIMLDFGFAINFMPTINSRFRSHILHLVDPLVQLDDLSVVRPLGLVKDVLLRVDSLMFLDDFYIIIDPNIFTLPLICLFYQIDPSWKR